MSKPILPLPVTDRPDQPMASTSGEGAQTALAAMIRKRKMGENHVEPEIQEAAPRQPRPEP
jgi:hypothetical protein